MNEPALIRDFRNVRSGSQLLVEETDAEILSKIPHGASNNMLWNFGHIVVEGCLMLYRSSQLELPIPADLVPLFKAGSSPEQWSKAVDIDRVLNASREFTNRLQNDYRDAAFGKFDPEQIDTAWRVESIDEAIAYHTVHESIHLGYMMAMRRFLIA